MKKLILLVVLTSPFIASAWTLFNPKNAMECVDKNIGKVRLQDASSLLGAACQVGYDKGDFKKEWVSAGKCIVDEVSRLYSFDEALKVINGCSNNAETFNLYKAALYQHQKNRAREQVETSARQEQQMARETERLERRLESERRSNALRDASRELDSTYRICNRVGSIIECF